MKGLIIKDIKLMKQQRVFIVALIGLLAGMAFFIPNANFTSGFVSGYLAILTSIFVVNTISYDEAENGYVFLFSLPFSRKEYVIEKYLLGLAMGIVSIAIVVVLSIIVGLEKGAIDYSDIGISMAVVFFGELFFLALLVPLQMKFGSEKSRFAIIAIVGCIYLFVYFLVKILNGLGFDVEASLNSISDKEMLIGVMLVDACLLLASIFISLRIMSKKEF